MQIVTVNIKKHLQLTARSYDWFLKDFMYKGAFFSFQVSVFKF